MAGRTIDVATFLNERRLSAFNYRLILLSCLITVFDGFDMLMISFTAPYMRDDLGLNKTMIGNIFSASLFGMLLGGFVFAYLGDRLGRKPTIIVAAFSFGVLTLMTALAQTYEQIFILRLLDGFALGGMLPLAWALNIEFVPPKVRSSVVTVIMLGYSSGSALAGPLTVMIAPHFGWRGVFVAGGAGSLVCALLLWGNLTESARFLVSRNLKPGLVAQILNRLDPRLGASAADTFVLSDEAALKTRHFRIGQLFEGDLKWITPLLWLGYVASTLAIYFLASWGPIVFEDLGSARNTAAYVASAGAILGAVAGLMLMRFTDRGGPFFVAFYPVIAVPLLLVIGLSAFPLTVFLPLSIAAAMVVGGEHYGVLSIAGIFYPSAIRASGAGWATSIAKVGGILGPIIGAMVLQSGLPIVRTYALLAICPAIVGLCALGIGFVVRRRHTRLFLEDETAFVPEI